MPQENKRKNQHKPLRNLQFFYSTCNSNLPSTIAAPEDELRPHVERYFFMGLSDNNILAMMQHRHLDHAAYGLSLKSLKRLRKKWNLLSTRQQNHTIDTALPFLRTIRTRYPKAGLREMIRLLLHEEKQKVSRRVVQEFFLQYEPELIRERRGRRLKRKGFWAAGVNDMWCVDQHDKWLRHGLYLHTGVEPYSGRILWLKVWWTNKNPKLISIPLVTQSDPGSENYGIANAHTALRHLHDPNLANTLQHRWMRKHQNIKPEIAWSQLRRRFTPGFEDILDLGLNNDWYDTNDPESVMLFRLLFIPWLQDELDLWREGFNVAEKRQDRNKILPHGRPQLIFEVPEMFGSVDFKVIIQPGAVENVRELYAPPDHQVHQLVPPEFSQIVDGLYTDMERPAINRDSIWTIYLQLLKRYRQWVAGGTGSAVTTAVRAAWDQEQLPIEPMPLIPNLLPLRNGECLIGSDGMYYMGGVNRGDIDDEEDPEDLETGGGAEDDLEDLIVSHFSDESFDEEDD